MQVEVSTEAIDADLAARLLGLYHAAFEPLEVLSPARQSFTDDEFLAQLASEKVVKIVARDGEGPCGLVLIATDLHEVPWISPRYFEAKFPDYYERGLVHYVTVIFVDEKRRGTWCARELMRAVASHALQARAYLVFDFCGANVAEAALPRLVDLTFRRVCRQVEWADLDAQTYFGVALEGVR